MKTLHLICGSSMAVVLFALGVNAGCSSDTTPVTPSAGGASVSASTAPSASSTTATVGTGGAATVGTGGTGGAATVGTGGAGGGGGTATVGTGGTGGAATIGTGGSGATGGGGAGGCGGATPVALTVLNFDSWCAVSINGAANTGLPVCVAAGEVNLSASAASATFELGDAPWHDTDGDKGSGEEGTITGTGVTAQSATTVKVSGTSACAWICCPFVNPSDGPPCPTADQCK